MIRVPHIRGLCPALLALLALALLATASMGCEGCGGSSPAEVRDFELDDQARFVYRDSERGFQHTKELEEIPLAQQGAAIVYGVDEEKLVSRDAMYVADLLEAQPGESVEARLLSRGEQFLQSRAGSVGHWQAKVVRRVAEHLAQMHPTSDRQRHSREMLERLEGDVPRETISEEP